MHLSRRTRAFTDRVASLTLARLVWWNGGLRRAGRASPNDPRHPPSEFGRRPSASCRLAARPIAISCARRVERFAVEESLCGLLSLPSSGRPPYPGRRPSPLLTTTSSFPHPTQGGLREQVDNPQSAPSSVAGSSQAVQSAGVAERAGEGGGGERARENAASVDRQHAQPHADRVSTRSDINPLLSLSA